MALAALETDPASPADLYAAMGSRTGRQRRKGWNVLEALKSDAMIVRDGYRYRITALGRHALDVTRSGEDFSSQGAGGANNPARVAA